MGDSVELEADAELKEFARLEDIQEVDVGGKRFPATSLHAMVSDRLGEVSCNGIDVDVEVELLAEVGLFWNCRLDEYDDAVDDEEEGLSAEAGRELTSTAESGVSERFPLVMI